MADAGGPPARRATRRRSASTSAASPGAGGRPHATFSIASSSEAAGEVPRPPRLRREGGRALGQHADGPGDGAVRARERARAVHDRRVLQRERHHARASPPSTISSGTTGSTRAISVSSFAFRPYFSIHRDQRETGYPQDVISPGDVIHCDVGIKYLRLNSDHQHLAYVPRLGETDVPAGLKARMADTTPPAGHLHGRLPPRRSRQRDAPRRCSRERRRQGMPEPRIYSHNLGLFLHQPGPLIGLPWEQENTGPRGEVRLEYDSAFVMELSHRRPGAGMGRPDRSGSRWRSPSSSRATAAAPCAAARRNFT